MPVRDLQNASAAMRLPRLMVRQLHDWIGRGHENAGAKSGRKLEDKVHAVQELHPWLSVGKTTYLPPHKTHLFACPEGITAPKSSSIKHMLRLHSEMHFPYTTRRARRAAGQGRTQHMMPLLSVMMKPSIQVCICCAKVESS